MKLDKRRFRIFLRLLLIFWSPGHDDANYRNFKACQQRMGAGSETSMADSRKVIVSDCWFFPALTPQQNPLLTGCLGRKYMMEDVRVRE